MTKNSPVQNSAPLFFTLKEAAEGVASHLGWHDGARDTLKGQFMQAARDGLLTVRDPHTEAPYSPPDRIREFYELVTRGDVNEWAARVGVSWRWEEQTQGPQGAPAQPAINSPPRLKRDAIAPVIELAQSKCRKPQDTAEVWGALLVLAEQQEKPLIGATDEGLQYHKNGTVAYFTRDALDKRLHPEKRRAPVKRR